MAEQRMLRTLVILLVLHVRNGLGGEQTISPYCDGFLALHEGAPSYRIYAPPFPLGFGDTDNDCTWYFHAPPDNVIKIEVIDLELRNNESLIVFDGRWTGSGPGVDVMSFVGQDFVSTMNSISIQLKSGPFFEGTAVLMVTIQNRRSYDTFSIKSADPAQCGGTISLDDSTPIGSFEATNHESGSYAAYCMWHVVAPPSTIVKLHFVSAKLEYYDNFMVVDSQGVRLAEFFNINTAPYDVLSDSNEILCLFDAFEVQSPSLVQIEVSFIDVDPLFDENAIHPLSGGHITLRNSSSTVAFRSNDFSTTPSVYVGSYWFITSPPGSKIKVEFLDVDTGSGVFLDVRSGFNAPLASISGTLDLDPFVTLDNSLVIWLYSQWRDPGQGVTIKVSVAGDSSWDASNTLTSCGGSINLDETNNPSLSFSSPNYGSMINQYTVCYWYFTSPPDTRVALEFTDIQTENGYVYVFDSINAPTVTVSSFAGEGVLQPFHSSVEGVTVLYNDLADSGNGRGLLAKVTIIAANSPNPESSCGGQITLDTSAPSFPFKTPWYDSPTGIMAYTSCYWYITSSADRVVSLQILDMQTVDASVAVYDSVSSLQNQIATIAGETVPPSFLSSGAGLTVLFSDFPSTSYTERGMSAVANLADKFTWDETTILASCGGTIAMEPSSTSLTFSTPTYPNTLPNGFFDCKWHFSGPDNMAFVLEVEDFDTSQTTYFYAYDSSAASSASQVAELSGNDITTTILTSESALFVRFYDPSTTDTARGIKAKVTPTGQPTWDDTITLDSCGGGISLDFITRTFLFTSPDYPSTFGDHFDCRWYVTSPSDTIISLKFIDLDTDPNSYLSIHDGSSIADTELLRASGSTFPTVVNATANAMTVHFFSNRASSGKGISLLVKFLGGSLPTSDVRLVGGSGPHEGRVELYYDDIWGTICDDDWGVEDATVVCSMLGYKTVIAARSQAYFGPGTGQIWLDDLQCTGDEKHITDCTHRMPTGSNNCGHSEDAGVTCGEGADVTCDSNSMTVLIDRVLLAHGDGASDVHLVDESCRGYDHDSIMVAVSTSYDHCGTTMEETDDSIIFSNIITYFQPKSHNGEKVTRDSILHIPVTCSFNRHTILGNSYQPQVGVVSFSEIGYGNFSLELGLYADDTFDHANRPTEDIKIPLDESAFFGANLTAVTDLTLLLESCWATPHPYPFDPIKYLIIDNGCAADPSVQFYDDVISDPLFSAFSVEAFAFVGEYDQVYMHCQVLVCDNSDLNSRCHQGCLSRTKRAIAADQRGASSRPHTVSNGPISPRRMKKEAGGFMNPKTLTDDSENFSKMVVVGASGILLAAGVMMAYVTFLKGQRPRGYRPLSTTDGDSLPEDEA